MFLSTMKPKALAKLAQHPGLFDRETLLAARDLYAFDNVFTAPLHGFRDTDDYWSRGSAKPHLHAIRIPALVVNAANDPFVPARQPAAAGRGRQPRHAVAAARTAGTWAFRSGCRPATCAACPSAWATGWRAVRALTSHGARRSRVAKCCHG